VEKRSPYWSERRVHINPLTLPIHYKRRTSHNTSDSEPHKYRSNSSKYSKNPQTKKKPPLGFKDTCRLLSHVRAILIKCQLANSLSRHYHGNSECILHENYPITVPNYNYTSLVKSAQLYTPLPPIPGYRLDCLLSPWISEKRPFFHSLLQEIYCEWSVGGVWCGILLNEKGSFFFFFLLWFVDPAHNSILSVMETSKVIALCHNADCRH
jgi:hypothetical protein